MYGRHVKTNGVIAVHISNHFLDLAPVVLRLALQFDYFSAVIDYDETPDEWWLYASTWVLLTKNSAPNQRRRRAGQQTEKTAALDR